MNRQRFSLGIREKLTLLFFAVTFVAVFANFLIVVPRLETQLRGNQVDEMRRTAARFGPIVRLYEEKLDTLLTAPQYGQQYLDQNVAPQLPGTRVAIVLPSQNLNPLIPQVTVFADTSASLDTGDVVNDWIASSVLTTGRAASGTVEIGGRLHAQAAIPIKRGSDTIGAAVFSTSLSSVNSIVRQQARRNLIAGVFALALALMVGLFASGFLARRIKRLERAAREVSVGNFTEPLPVDSNDELGQLARAFNNMQNRLGRADRARKAFIANASHELRTPLFSLGGYVELMRDEELDAETQREFLETMHDQIQRLTKLATDLLDLSRIDAGSLDIQLRSVDLDELVEGVAREFEPRAAQRESTIAIVAEDELQVDCDPDRVAQIVRILIDNALSHTPAGTGVRVEATAGRNGVDVTVADDGPGIPAEDISRIFDRFHTGNKSGGTGLGLSIANELATAMRTELKVDSGPGGTTFTLTLPRNPRGQRITK